ncbi:MAG: hypothetical protein RR846_00535 [Oscillospiraceae bacterium]
MGYDLHISDKIRNIGKDAKPPKRLVGIRMTAMCFMLTIAAYFFVSAQLPDGAAKIMPKIQIKSPMLVVIAVLLLVLCVLLAILIKVIKDKKQ